MAPPNGNVAVQLRRRRSAFYRCVPLANGYRDPLDALVAQIGPSTFGLTDAELAREWSRLTTAGWSHGEVALVLVDALIAIRRPR